MNFQVGNCVRLKLEFCLATIPMWYSGKGIILKLESNRSFQIATILWDSGQISLPETSFTFNLELIEQNVV